MKSGGEVITKTDRVTLDFVKSNNRDFISKLVLFSARTNSRVRICVSGQNICDKIKNYWCENQYEGKYKYACTVI